MNLKTLTCLVITGVLTLSQFKCIASECNEINLSVMTNVNVSNADEIQLTSNEGVGGTSLSIANSDCNATNLSFSTNAPVFGPLSTQITSIEPVKELFGTTMISNFATLKFPLELMDGGHSKPCLPIAEGGNNIGFNYGCVTLYSANSLLAESGKFMKNKLASSEQDKDKPKADKPKADKPDKPKCETKSERVYDCPAGSTNGQHIDYEKCKVKETQTVCPPK